MSGYVQHALDIMCKRKNNILFFNYFSMLEVTEKWGQVLKYNITSWNSLQKPAAAFGTSVRKCQHTAFLRGLCRKGNRFLKKYRI